MLERLVSVVLRHPQYKLLALALAIVAWTYVQGDEVHETRIRVPVVWTLPRGMTTPEALPSTVTLHVRGTRAATRRAREAEVILPVDVGGIGVGEHTLAFGDFRPRGLPSGVDVLSTAPSSVRFVLDEVAGRKVAVKPVLVGEPAPDHLIDAVDVHPEVVEITGPRVVVEPLHEIATAPIDVSRITGDTVVEVDLDLPRSVRLVDPGVTPTAEIRVVRRDTKRAYEATVVVQGGSDAWRVRPATLTVELRGPAGALGAIEDHEVLVVVRPPDGGGGRFDASWEPGGEGRLRVVHPAGRRVEVEGVEPSRVEVVRR